MLRTLAQGCGSSAWVAAVHGEHNWVVGNFSGAGAARRLGRQSPRRCLGERRAERIGRAGGRRLSAERPLGLRQRLRSCAMDAARLHGEDRRRAGIADVPACRSSQVEIIDDWHVMGLCGTGSKSIVGQGRHRAGARSVSMHDLKTGTAPGAEVHPGNPLYRTPRNLLALFSLSSVIVGLAERAVAEFVDYHPRAAVARLARRRSGGRAIDGGGGRGAGRDGGAGRRAHHRPQHRAGRSRGRRSLPSRSPGRGAMRPMRRSLRIPPSS